MCFLWVAEDGELNKCKKSHNRLLEIFIPGCQILFSLIHLWKSRYSINCSLWFSCRIPNLWSYYSENIIYFRLMTARPQINSSYLRRLLCISYTFQCYSKFSRKKLLKIRMQDEKTYNKLQKQRQGNCTIVPIFFWHVASSG